jgi:hypothetical protein
MGGAAALAAALAVGIVSGPAVGADRSGQQSRGGRAGANQTAQPGGDWLYRFVVSLIVQDYIESGGNVQQLSTLLNDIEDWFNGKTGGTSSGTTSTGSTTGGTGSTSGTTGSTTSLSPSDRQFRALAAQVAEQYIRKGGDIQELPALLNELSTWWASQSNGSSSGKTSPTGGKTTGGTTGGTTTGGTTTGTGSTTGTATPAATRAAQTQRAAQQVRRDTSGQLK